LLAFLSSLVIVVVEYVTAAPTKAKPAKNGHIFFPSRAAVRKNDSDAYGMLLIFCGYFFIRELVNVAVCDRFFLKKT